MSIAQEPVGWFQGSKNANLRLKGNAKKTQHKKVSWPSRDAELMQLQMEKFRRPQSTAVDAEISRILKDRDDIEAVFQNLINTLVSDERERGGDPPKGELYALACGRLLWMVNYRHQ
ncbi:hypothetical protein OSTOST_25534, partial [Ostertagia ostertagi]